MDINLIGIAKESDLADHENNTSNPHSVTAAQLGLGSVDNRSYSADANISGAVTLDSSVNDVFFRTLTGNVTITITGLTNGKRCKIYIKQAAAAAYTVTINGVNYRFAAPPVQTTQFGKVDTWIVEMANGILFGYYESWR